MTRERRLGRAVRVVLVGQLLCTALPPLVRRLRAGDERPAVAVPGERERVAAELRMVADRLADERHLHHERETLRRLARTLE